MKRKFNVMPPEPEYQDEWSLPVYRGVPRKLWYPLLHRHKEKTPIDKHLLGNWIKIDQAIVRTGYILEPTDVDYYDPTLTKTVDAIFAQQLKSFTPPSERSDHELAHTAMEVFGPGVINRALYHARNLWMQKGYKRPEYRQYYHLRTFWYTKISDINAEPAVWVKALRITRHMVGWHYAAIRDYDHYNNEYDYIPGGLKESLHQSVYACQGRMGNNYETYWEGICEVHPADVLAVHPNGPPIKERNPPIFLQTKLEGE